MGFLRGLTYPFRGLSFAFAHADVLRWFAAPVALGAALIVGELLGLRWAIHHYLADATWWKLVVAWLAGLTAVVAVFLALSGTLAAPFCDVISRRTEAHRVGHAPVEARLGGQVVSLFHALVRGLCYLAVVGTLLVVGFFVPLTWIASLAAASIYAALDALDYPATRRGFSFGRKLSLLRSHSGLTLGFGLATSLLAAIPVFGLFAAPAAAVGGTLLFLDLERPRS
jgi:CysZ protein